MSDIDEIHSCSYYCRHPKCIERQRDELRDRYLIVSVEETQKDCEKFSLEQKVNND